MKIRQWLGYNEDASQYLLRPGELRVLNNLQARRPGMLISRSGVKKIYGQYDDDTIHGIYRRSTILGSPSDFIWLQKVLVDKELTTEQLDSRINPQEYVWSVKRIQDDQARVIDTFPIAPNGTEITNFCIAEDRHGRLFIFYGHGVAPRLYRPELIGNSALTLGLKAPVNQPKVTPSGTGYFIEGVEIDFAGGSYNSPPVIDISGEATRPAKLKTIIQRGKIVGVDVVDGGSGYETAPSLEVDSDDQGSGFRAVGLFSQTARTLTGFSEAKAGTVYDDSIAPSSTQTYGTKDGTESNHIMYKRNVDGESKTVNVVPGTWTRWYPTEKGNITNVTNLPQVNGGYQIDISDARGIKVGTRVRIRAWKKDGHGANANKYNSTNNTWATVTHVDEVNHKIAINSFGNFGNLNVTAPHTVTYYYEFVFEAGNPSGLDGTGSGYATPSVMDIHLETVEGLEVGMTAKLSFLKKGLWGGTHTIYGTGTAAINPNADSNGPSTVWTYSKANGATGLGGGRSIASLGAYNAATHFTQTHIVPMRMSGSSMHPNNAGIDHTYEADFNEQHYTILSIDRTNNTIQLDGTYYHGSGMQVWQDMFINGENARFTFEPRVGKAKATYNKDTRRWYANIPIESASINGEGAKATLEFSPLPFGYAVNTSGESSKGVEDTGLRQHFNISGGEGGKWTTATKLSDYLYDEYWSGSDYDRRNSAENARYGGLQAGSQFRHGFSGSVNGRPADVYWPDYSKLSVWFNTGVNSNSLSQWTRKEVAVTVDSESGAKYIEFDLEPTRNAKKVIKPGGFSLDTQYDDSSEIVDAVKPRVRIGLRDCPDTWLVSGDECLPTKQKEQQELRLAWFSSSAGLPRPIVDLNRNSAGEIETTDLQIINAGSGWAKNTQFRIRLYQANAYAQHIDYNTAVTETTKQVYHNPYSTANRYVEFRVQTDVADTNTPHGPPHTLITPAVIGIPGDGYAAGDIGDVRLLKREIGSPLPSNDNTTALAQLIRWNAELISELTGSTSAQNTRSIYSINVFNKGRNYQTKPEIIIKGGGDGYGLVVDPILKDGRIEKVRIVDNGIAYTEKPELTTVSRAAKLTPAMRPAMRGKYRCAFRYADRSEQIIKTITATKGENSTTIIVSDTTDLEPGMILEATEFPHHTRIKSIIGDELELNQEIVNFKDSYQTYWNTSTAQDASLGESIVLTATSTASSSRLNAGESFFSPDSKYKLEMTVGGDLVLFEAQKFITGRVNAATGEVIESTFYIKELWKASTSGIGSYTPVVGAYAEISTAGRLVIKYVEQNDTNTTSDDVTVVAWDNGVDAPTMPASLYMCNDGSVKLKGGEVIANISVRDPKKPVSYSDLSPIIDVDAGPSEDRSHASEMKWSLEGATPPDRADMVELWRTSSDQSLVFYRVEAYGIPSTNGVQIEGRDTLTDEELFDIERPNYAAMPVVLPNGGLNAYRFGEPRTDMKVAVAFQDRLWMGVSSSGEDVNTLYYSEFDEFESVPDINELPIQNNSKTNDTLTALVPFGSMLLAMQHTHTYAISYNTDPAIDASIQMMSHRGTLHQRCWDVHENILYAADESGIYSMSRNGEVADISLPIRDFFVSELIDFSKRETFFLQTDPRTHILRFFCCTKENSEDTPTLALCYDIQAQTWWTESYPNSITAACTGRPSTTQLNTILLGATDGNLYELDGEADQPNASLTSTVVSNGGVGYREAPTITVPNCKGATAQGVVSEGRLVDVIIHNAGWDSSYGIDLLTEDGFSLTGHDNKYIQGAEYAPIKLEIGDPDAGGTKATAIAHWEVMPEVKRFCTISEGESFVRLETSSFDTIQPATHVHLVTEDGFELEMEQDGTATLTEQPPVVEAGMEAIADFLPLNAIVDKVERNTVHLKHPDGTEIKCLGGAPRVNGPDTTVVLPTGVTGTVDSFCVTSMQQTNATDIIYVDNPSCVKVGATVRSFTNKLPIPLTVTEINVDGVADKVRISRNIIFPQNEKIAIGLTSTAVSHNQIYITEQGGVEVGSIVSGVGGAVVPANTKVTGIEKIVRTKTIQGTFTPEGGVEEITLTDVTEVLYLVSLSENIALSSGATQLTFRTVATIKNEDRGSNVTWLEDGGTRQLVRFIKPSYTNIPFRMQTGFMQVVSDDYAKKGDGLIDKSVSLVYQPTYGDKEIELIERFNGQEEMRPNTARRDRGGPGTFQQRQDSASTVLNMNRESSSLGFATGVAKAKFASRANGDMTGTDQHVQVELHGRPDRASQWDRTNFFIEDNTVKPAKECVIHQVSIEGVLDENG